MSPRKLSDADIATMRTKVCADIHIVEELQSEVEAEILERRPWSRVVHHGSRIQNKAFFSVHNEAPVGVVRGIGASGVGATADLTLSRLERDSGHRTSLPSRPPASRRRCASATSSMEIRPATRGRIVPFANSPSICIQSACPRISATCSPHAAPHSSSPASFPSTSSA